MKKKHLAFISLLFIFAIGVPLTLFIFSKQQKIRSHAEKSTTLYFSQVSSDSSPLQTQIGDTIPLDVMVNPGTNLVSLVKLEIIYDPTKFAAIGTSSFQPNLTAFSQIIEGPVVTSGKILVTLSIGTDPEKSIKQITRVGTLKLKALNSATDKSTTPVTYGGNTQILALGANAGANENVLSNTQPAIITINLLPAPTCTPRPLCLDTTPKCLIPEPVGGWCAQPTSISNPSIIPTKPISATPYFPSPTSCAAPTGIYCPNGTIVKINPTPAECSRRVFCIPFTPTPPISAATKFLINGLIDGIGSRGDNSNPDGSLSNKKPLHPNRNLILNIFNASSQLVASATGTIKYNSSTGKFNGSISLTSPISSDNYIIKAATGNHLVRLLPGIQNIKTGQTNQLPDAIFIAGDITNDNQLNIRDYNILLGCYSDLTAPASCNNFQKNSADLNDDGEINQFDYNLFLRELATQPGQ